MEQSLAYYAGMAKSRRATAMHLYAQGGHAFVLRTGQLSIAQCRGWWKHGMVDPAPAR